MEVFASEVEWKQRIEKLMNLKNRNDFKAVRVTPAKITVETKVEIR